MNDPDTERRQAIGLFRYGLIADLAQLPPPACPPGSVPTSRLR